MQEILVALKAIDLEDFCKYFLHAKLAKDRSGIAENPDIKAWMQETLANHSFTPVLAGDVSITGKTQNRLAGSKTFSDCLKTTVADLKDRLGLRKQPATTDAGSGSAAPNGSNNSANANADEGGADSASDDDADEDASRTVATDSDSGSDEEDFPDGVSVDDDEEVLKHLQDTDSEGSDSDSSAGSEVEEPVTKRKGTKRKLSVSVSPPPSKRPTTSAFLPSLSTGYVAGDPDGSVYPYSDDEADGKPQRKNRRGQRARQA